MSAAKQLLFARMAEARRADLVDRVHDVLCAMVLPDAAHMRPLAERIVDGGGTRAQRQAAIDALLSRCDPDAHDAALELGGVR